MTAARSPFLTPYSLPNESWWAASTDLVDPHQTPQRIMFELIRRAPGYDAVILRGASGARQGYADQIAGAVIARRGTPIVLAECTWEVVSRRLTAARRTTDGLDLAPDGSGRLAKTMIAAADTTLTHYCVLSEEERSVFASRWSVDQARVHNTASLATADDVGRIGPRAGGVFAGGNSLRDYRSLISVAPTLPSEVIIATTISTPMQEGKLSVRPLSQQAYEDAAKEATIVVVPMAHRAIRSAGQQTYLNAMLQGKPVVVTDTLGVRDHIQDGVTGFLVPPESPEALGDVLRLLLADPDLQRRVGAAARQSVLRNFTRAQYFGKILKVAEHAAALAKTV